MILKLVRPRHASKQRLLQRSPQWYASCHLYHAASTAHSCNYPFVLLLPDDNPSDDLAVTWNPTKN